MCRTWRWNSACNRSPVGVAPFYARYQDRIYTYLRTRTGPAEDAADLTQQIFVQALDALPRPTLPVPVDYAQNMVQ